jgi:hypothetical protein
VYEVRSGSKQVRIALVRGEDLERLRHDQPHGFLVATPPAGTGGLHYAIHSPGDYAIVVDNRAESGVSPHEAMVHLRVRLDFAGDSGPTVTLLSPARRLAVILISFAVFFGIVLLSARRLYGAFKQ